LKAILLAGGRGTRAKPFTEYFPKAMFPLNGRPMIDYIVRYLAQFSQINEIIIVCDFDNFGKQIINYFEGKGSIVGKSITFVEDKNSGTGGSLLRVEKYVGQDECFLVWFADNLCALHIEHMIHQYHQANAESGGITGMIVVRKRRREETARVILDESQIKEFSEKHVVNLEKPEALGIYLFSKRIFEYLQKRLNEGSDSFDLSYHILNQITSTDKLFSYDIGENVEWIDAESPAYTDRNKDIIERILLQMRSVIGDVN
jgi:mannose-1-phosphate guanylyltransferase